MTAVIYGSSPERISLIYESLQDEDISPRITESVDQMMEFFDEGKPRIMVLADVDERSLSALQMLRAQPDGERTILAAMVDHDDVERLSVEAQRLVDLFLTPPFKRSPVFRTQVAAIRRYVERSRQYNEIDRQRRLLEYQYRLLFEESLDAVIIAGPGSEVLEANRAAVDLFGYHVEELSLQDLYVDSQAGEEFWKHLEREGDIENYELEMKHRDGARLQCLLNGTVQRRREEEVETYQLIVRDCTERENLREGVLDAQKRFQAIFNSTFQFIGLLNAEGILLEANKPALQFVGVDREDVVGKPFWETPWWNHSQQVRTRLRHGIDRAARGHVVRFESEHVGSDGEEIIVDFSLTPVTDETGEVAFIVPEGRDVTDQRRIEREMMALREEERRQIGHDLQEWLGQMLTGIAMISESLKRDLQRTNSEHARKAEDILRFVREADEFTHHLSRGVIPVELDAEGLTTALQQLADHCRASFDIDCIFEEEGNVLVPDNTISTSLYWLVQEAIENAVSTGKASRVRITLMQTDRHIRVMIRDNGMVPAESVDIFMREDRDLRLMQYRARLIGGSFELTAPSSGGRVFTCTVPIEAVA